MRDISVLPPNLPLHWHEAVALACAIADAIEQGRLHAVPRTGELALASDGSVHLPGLSAFAAEGTRSVSGAAAVADLRRLLADLLDSSAPPELKRLAAEQDGTGTIAEFRRALRFFERPSREADLRALAARIDEEDEKGHLQAELDRLTREARAVPHAHEAPQSTGTVRLTSLRRALVAAVAVGGAAAVIGVSVILIMQGDTGSGTSAPAVQATSKVGLIERVRDRVRSAFAPPAPEEKHEVSTPVAPHKERPRGARRVTNAPPRAAEGAVTVIESSGNPLPDVLPSFRTWTWDGTPPPPRESRRVYDGANPDVVAAMLIRPQLPAVDFPGARGHRLGRVMVVIDEQGRVEQVRLMTTTPERRYYDAMILAAIKAWVFQPATRAGQPVRYRVVIPLT